ncbi:MAG: ATP-binding protein, partial [Synechococcales bacterium]|nr:ATP-binding protein [Synechococcales bacterium]
MSQVFPDVYAVAERSKKVITPGTQPKVWGGRLFGAEQMREVPLWVGRDRLLAELRDELLVQRRKVLVLVGQGGIGKTSLAVKLLEACGVEARRQRLAENCPFEGVIYVRVQEGMSFDGVVVELLRGLERSRSEGMRAEQLIGEVIGGLQRSRCLLVLDNLEDVLAGGKAVSAEWGQLLWALVDRTHQSQVVITSRELPIDLADPRDSSGIPNPAVVSVERMGGIDAQASVDLLRQLGLRDREEDLEWVAQRVAGQVQVLTLLAKWARKPGMLRQRPELVTADAKPILRVQVGKLRETTRDLLKRMAVLRVGIGLEGLTFLRLYEDDEAEFGRFWMATENQEPIEFDRLELDQTQELVNELVNVSLVDEQYDEQHCAESYSLHRVMIEFMQAEYAAELPALIKRVYSFYRSGSELNQPKTLEDLRSLLEAQHFAFQLRNYDEAKNLIYQLEDYLERWGYWNLLHDLYYQIVDRLPEPSQPYILQRLGSRERDWGNWEQA